MTFHTIEYPTIVDVITGRFMDDLERHQVVDFTRLAQIAWDTIGIPADEDTAAASKAAAYKAMDRRADYDVSLDEYAEEAYQAIGRTAQAHGWEITETGIVER